VVTKGYSSKGYREFRRFAPALLEDETEGYAYLLELLFDELAFDLPGLFGNVGVGSLFRVPASTLREVVEQLNSDELESAWTDDTTLGWVYQYWNDPEREALDAKINDGGKIEPHEIASKTQMYTERYMVEWLLHNSLGLTWLCMCKKHGWKPDAEMVLDNLDRRRADWRKKREAGEVPRDALMPVDEGLEERWKYYVPQPIPDDAVTSAPESIHDLKLLDPACGSGHFLIIAFDLLTELYREEARHRKESWSDQEIAESILSNNLFGVDLDHRAIQIAAAGLYLKAKQLCREPVGAVREPPLQPTHKSSRRDSTLLSPLPRAGEGEGEGAVAKTSASKYPRERIRHLNLVGPILNLVNLSEDDPAYQRLAHELSEDAGIPKKFTKELVSHLAGIDHLGSLFKVDAAVDETLGNFDSEYGKYTQVPLGEKNARPAPNIAETKATLLTKLEQFLAQHQGEEDLGVRLDGEELAAGVRFMRIVRENTYDIVVGNPPYLGTGKMADQIYNAYVAEHYPRGKADLYAAFLERGLELARQGGMSVMITMRGWMFIIQFQQMRENLLYQNHISLIADLHFGAFSTMKDVSVAMTVCRRVKSEGRSSVAIRPVDHKFVVRDVLQPSRNESGFLVPAERYEFDPRGFKVIDGEPIVYWWGEEFLSVYRGAPKMKEIAPAKQGLATADNTRFLRYTWELTLLQRTSIGWGEIDFSNDWQQFIKGGEGTCWFEPARWLIRWRAKGLEVKNYEKKGKPAAVIRNEHLYFRHGIAFSMLGNCFQAREHWVPSVFDTMGSSVFPEHIEDTLCILNSEKTRRVMQSLNPTIHFQQGDVDRVPIIAIESSKIIRSNLRVAFSHHEAAREASVEFKRPGPSPWRYAQDWAQRSVDRPAGEPLPPYQPEYDPALPTQFVSFGVGVALGRFGENSEGILDETKREHLALINKALPNGILFLSDATERDSLEHPACKLLKAMWEEHGGGDWRRRPALLLAQGLL
jgi:hypothetical protein